MKNNIGTRVKRVRLHVDETQQAFSERTGVTQSFLSNVEKGKSSPTDSMIDLIGINYKVNKNWLQTGNGSMFEDDYIKAEAVDYYNRVDNVELLENIIMFIEMYLTDNSLKATPQSKAKLIMHYFQFFNAKTGFDRKAIRVKIENSIDILFSAIGDNDEYI